MRFPSTSPAGAAAPDWRGQLPESGRCRLRIWLWSVAAMTLAVLVIGGITRLTMSGLSIVDWRPLMGAVPPLNEAQWAQSFERYREFPEYQQLRQGMTLAHFKTIFFWEYLHRLVARLIGLVFLIPFVAFWLSGYVTWPLASRAAGLFALGAMQGVMGWLMVKSGLVDRPSVSHYRLAAHLALAFVIFGAAVWLARELAIGRERASASAVARKVMARGLAAVGGLLAVQIVWGAFVAGLKAGFIFNTFPLMAGGLGPPLMSGLEPAALNFIHNPAVVQWTHRVLGTVLLLAAFAFFLRARKSGLDRTSRGLNRALLLLIATQYLLGVLTLLYIVPVSLAVMHQATAMVIVGVWVWWVHHVRNLAVLDRLENGLAP